LIFLGSTVAAGPDPAVGQLAESVSRVESAIGGFSTFVASPAIEPVPTVRPPEEAFRPPGPPPPEKPRRPPREDRPLPRLHPQLTSLKATASIDGVTLAWSTSLEKSTVPARTSNPAAAFFKIERRPAGGATWTLVAESRSLEHFDDAGAPNREYEYRVTLGSDDPPWVHENPGRLTDRTARVRVRTLRRWSFEFSQLKVADPDEGIRGSAYVKIVKYDRDLGFVEISKIVSEGSPLGSVQVVRSPKKNRMVAVDFGSGAALKSVRVGRPEAYARRVCTPRLNGQNLLACAGPAVIQETYDIVEVEYVDEDGAPRTSRHPSGLGPKPDHLCDDHD
jgi:hypothetical protein